MQFFRSYLVHSLQTINQPHWILEENSSFWILRWISSLWSWFEAKSLGAKPRKGIHWLQISQTLGVKRHSLEHTRAHVPPVPYSLCPLWQPDPVPAARWGASMAPELPEHADTSLAPPLWPFQDSLASDSVCIEILSTVRSQQLCSCAEQDQALTEGEGDQTLPMSLLKHHSPSMWAFHSSSVCLFSVVALPTHHHTVVTLKHRNHSFYIKTP